MINPKYEEEMNDLFLDIQDMNMTRNEFIRFMSERDDEIRAEGYRDGLENSYPGHD